MIGKVQFIIKSTVPAHAPVQLRFKFGEVPSEIYESYSSYEGTLSKARYMKIEHLSSASDMDFYIRDITCLSVTSAGENPGASSIKLPSNFEKISEVSIKTLNDCMQTVFEDGPKRDRRIWIGDLKLQALANYYSFKILIL